MRLRADGVWGGCRVVNVAEGELCHSPVKRAVVTFHLCDALCMRYSAGAGRFPWLVSPGADALRARILEIPHYQVKRNFYNNGRNGRELDVMRTNTPAISPFYGGAERFFVGKNGVFSAPENMG